MGQQNNRDTQPEKYAKDAWAVIFDWDGVIVDSAAAHQRSWELLAQEEHKSLPPGHFEKGFGMKNIEIISRILAWTSDPDEIERLSRRKEEIYRQLISRGDIRFVPGAIRLLQSLQSHGIPMAIASSTDRANIQLVLEKFLPEIHFATLVCAEDVSRSKPAPDVFLAGARQLGLPPDCCVVVEDAPAGIQAARQAGMKVVAVATTRDTAQLGGADLVVPDLDAIDLETLAGLVGRSATNQ